MPRSKPPRIIEPSSDVLSVPTRGLASIWSSYGLASDPFFQEELRSDSAALYPISLHVGREEELRMVSRQVGGAPSTRLVIEGAPGLGKTSFVNKVKAELSEAGIVTHSDPVRIVADTTVLSFVADVLRVLLRIRAMRGLDGDAFWTRTARLVEGEDTLAGGFTLGPVGVSYQGGRVPAEAPLGTLYDVVAEGIERVTHDLGGPILLHVNNLENLGEDDALRAARLLRDLRDFLLLPGAHWVFVGAAGTDETVFRAYDQVAGIFPNALVLEPLTGAEVAEILSRRYLHLATDRDRLIPPVEPDVAAELYGVYQGDLRNFLRLLGDAATLALGIEGIEPLSAARIVAVAAPRYAKVVERRVGTADFGYLEAALRASEGGEFNVAGAAQATGLGQSGASRLIARLREAGVLVQSRTAGKRVFYRPTGQVAIAFGVARPAPPPAKTRRPRRRGP
jgi:hypothetical protein